MGAGERSSSGGNCTLSGSILPGVPERVVLSLAVKRLGSLPAGEGDLEVREAFSRPETYREMLPGLVFPRTRSFHASAHSLMIRFAYLATS